MQAAGIQPGGQVAISVAQRGVLQNPGGATGNLGGAAAPVQRRGRNFFRRQVQGATQQGATQQGAVPQVQGGTPTTGNNPVATNLLLAPTFTPIQADVVLDTVNMRVAFPVSAVDGEYLITMQTGAAQAQPPQEAPQQGQTPTPQEGQRPATPEGQTPPQGQQPAAEPKPAGEATPAAETPLNNGTAPAAGGERKPEGQAAATPEGEKKPAGEAAAATPEGEKKPEGEAAAATPEGEKKPERRQEKKEPAIGDKPPQGSVYLTMKEVNQMADLMQWGGQAPISQMMTDYVKANNGSSANYIR